MTDLGRFAARVQAALALILVVAVVIVAMALLWIDFTLELKKIAPDDWLKTLAETVFSALINMGMVGIGFWLSRHRPDNSANDSNPTKPGTPAMTGAKTP